jgi:hypothetical protein
MSGLFLKRFPEEKALWNLNQERMKGFIKFTKKAIEESSATSIEMDAAKMVLAINNLGFITISSQEGEQNETVNPTILSGPEKGLPILNKYGSPAVFNKYSERAYCDGFLRTDLLKRFEEKLTEYNSEILILRHPWKEGRINLTKSYTEYADETDEEDYFTNTPEYTVGDIMELREVDNGYYNGPPLPPLPISLKKWTYISVVDMRYGNRATGKYGLYTYIEQALEDILKVSKGGARRRTMKKGKSRRARC